MIIWMATAGKKFCVSIWRKHRPKLTFHATNISSQYRLEVGGEGGGGKGLTASFGIIIKKTGSFVLPSTPLAAEAVVERCGSRASEKFL